MIMYILLKPEKTMVDVANKVVELNTIAADLLVNGPIPVNPQAEQPENLVGDCCTPVNAAGYAGVLINAYRKLILDPQMLAFLSDTFQIIVGEPVETIDEADVFGGVFA